MSLKNICIFILLGVNMLSAVAQSFGVKGKVLDSLTHTAVPYASIGLLNTDSVVVASSVTDHAGDFVLKCRNGGNYFVKVSFVGYRTHYEKIELQPDKFNYTLDNIYMVTDDQLLGEAIIKSVLAKVEQKEDTTIFNAGAYRVPKGSTLEALVKQLPGVDVAADGAITWNGKQIRELLVNGKDFFKGDNNVAMKNLPSDLVSKIKAYMKKSDYTEQTGIDDGDEKAVLDIKTKAKLDHSWISNLDVAYGTKDRYSADLFVSRFSERSRISAYVSLGNVDKYANVSGGLSSNKSGGLDFSWSNGKEKKEGGKLELGGSAYYGYTGTDMVSTSSSETFLSSESTSSFSNSMSRNSYSSAYIGANIYLEWNPDSMTSIKIRPSFNHNSGDNEGESRAATFDGDPYVVDGIYNPLDSIFSCQPNSQLTKLAVNRNAHQSMGDNESNSLAVDLSALRRFNTSGRNLSFRAKGNFRKSVSNSFSISDIYYFNEADGRFLNQYSHTPSQNWDYNLRLGYAEPFTDRLVAEVRYGFGFKYSDSDKSRYHLDRLGGSWGDADNPPPIGTLPTAADSMAAARDWLNSQYATYKYYDHTLDVSMQYKNEKLRMNVGVELNPEKTKMEYNRPGQDIDTLITRDVFQVVPDVRFRYRFTDTKSLDFRYRGYASQPSMTNLLAVVDNSNPLSVSMGNPGLKPSWTNTLSLNYNSYHQERQSGIYAGADYNQTGRSVSNLMIYDQTTGVRYMRPENINGNWSANAYVMFNTGFGKEKRFTVYTYTNMSYRNDVGYVSSFASAHEQSPSTLWTLNHVTNDYDNIFSTADIRKNKTKTLGINENIKLGYNKEWLDLALSGSFTYDHSSPDLQESSGMNTGRFDYGAIANLTFDCGVSFSTDIRMRSRRGYSDAFMNTDELLWNAQIAYSFLKDRSATLSMKCYDILHNQSNVSRRVDAMQRSDSWTNGVHSFVMVHFVYKLNLFPGKTKSETTRGKRKNKHERAGRSEGK